MERLTGRNEKGDLLFNGEHVYAGDMYEAASALEEYEDIGTVEEFAALKQAESEGRIVKYGGTCKRGFLSEDGLCKRDEDECDRYNCSSYVCPNCGHRLTREAALAAKEAQE